MDAPVIAILMLTVVYQLLLQTMMLTGTHEPTRYNGYYHLTGQKNNPHHFFC